MNRRICSTSITSNPFATVCPTFADNIVYIVESGSDLSDDEWKSVKDFMQEINNYALQDSSAVAVVQYTSVAQLSMSLGATNGLTRAQVNELINALDRNIGGTIFCFFVCFFWACDVQKKNSKNATKMEKHKNTQTHEKNIIRK